MNIFVKSIIFILKHICIFVCFYFVRYDPGGSSSVMVFVYRIPENCPENERLTMMLRIMKKVEPDIPIYHTRAMRREFKKEVSSLHSSLEPHLLRHIYRSLTGDCSSQRECSEIDERVKVALETDDPELVIDLRQLNKGHPMTPLKLTSKKWRSL